MEIGLVVPPDNTIIEREIPYRLLNIANVYVGRLPTARAVGGIIERTRHYISGIPQVVDQLQCAATDEIIVACTGASYLIGANQESEYFASLTMSAGVRVVSTLSCIKEQLDLEGIQHILLISPYSQELTNKCIQFWEESEKEVTLVSSIARGDSPYEVPPSDIAAAVSSIREKVNGQLNHGEAVLISGTGVPTMNTIDTFGFGTWRENTTIPTNSDNIPIYSSTSCIISHIRRMAQEKQHDDSTQKANS